MDSSANPVKPGTVILHSRADDVVPFADSEELAKTNGATLIEVGNDQRFSLRKYVDVPADFLEAILSIHGV